MHPGPIEPARIAAALASVRSGPNPATAIVTGNIATTIAVIRHLGSDFDTTPLVGFDDFPLADLLRPGLTVVAQGDVEIGRTTVDLFRTRLANPSRPVQTVTVPTKLIVRGSGELPR